MFISKFQVLNYKSYLDSDEIEFKPGFNVITGSNSAGKTALLEALTLQFASNPHRSIRTIPAPGVRPDEVSSVHITMVISGDELLHLFQSMGSGVHTFAASSGDETQATMARRLEEIISSPELSLSTRFEKRPNGEQFITDQTNFLGSYKPFVNAQNQQLNLNAYVTATGFRIDGGPFWAGIGQDARVPLASWLKNRIYRFKAERFNVGRHTFGDTSTLLPDASNLPQVLIMLTANPARFEKLNRLINEILPQVRRVSVRPSANTEVEVQIWPHDYKSERWDLAIPLNQCGSGVGQVLAILYLLLTSEHSQVIIIDEPQSFLHPGAIRKLIEVLKQYPQHQYIFATHSPTVITASDPSTFTLVRANDGVSVAEVMDTTNTKHLRTYLAELGARLGDVFGADNILWVEGQTEEQSFPLILRKISNKRLMGTAIVGIRQTADLQGRDKSKVLEMYRRLSEAKTLLPPAIAFVFDEECLTEQQKADLGRMGAGIVHFLPRRMYENYLLNPTALAAVMNAIEDFRNPPVTEDEVRQLLQTKSEERKQGGRQLRYFCNGVSDIPADWERKIDAAKLLEDIFTELSETRVSYEKTTHSVAITEWLIANRPDTLQEIADFLQPLIPN